MKNREMLRGARSLCQGSALINRDMGLQHSLNSGTDEKSNRDFTGSEQELERDARTFSLFRKEPASQFRRLETVRGKPGEMLTKILWCV